MEQSQQMIKVCMLGASGVGKSSILKRFVNDEFEEREPTTLGSAFQEKVVNYKGASYRFQIWDTAGQEKFAPLAHIYYRDAEIAFLVYDITNKDSFGTLREWYAELKEKGPKGIMICVLGNKLDLEDQQEVARSVAREYAKGIKALFTLTSAKENSGITELFDRICGELQKRKNDMLSSQMMKTSMSLSMKKKEEKENDSGTCRC